jgi:hypothetical protein
MAGFLFFEKRGAVAQFRLLVITAGKRGEPQQILSVSAPLHPPLSCRTSPPQGGRLAGRNAALKLQRWKLAKVDVTANLPP